MHNYHMKIIPRRYHLAQDLCKTWKAIGHVNYNVSICRYLADLKVKFKIVCKYLWQVTESVEEFSVGKLWYNFPFGALAPSSESPASG